MTEMTRILLVDDDDVDRLIVGRALQQSGLAFELVEAADGAQALAICENHEFDCVFLDYRLPDIDGAEVFKSMTKDHHSTAAVIFLTGQDDDGLAIELMESGAVDYLTKSEISAPTLKRAIRYAAARRSFLKQLSDLAQVDGLTGLANRSAFDKVVSRSVSHVRRAGNMAAVALLDLDRFKSVNDTMGHPAGDRLLQLTAQRLSDAVRDTDTVVRLGGDEFVVVAPDLADDHSAAKLARKLIGALSKPFLVEDQELHISTSVGIALAPADGDTALELLKCADLALYKAKADGRGRYHFYDGDLNVAVQAQREIEIDIRQALAEDEFELYYQPKIDIASEQVIGMEALLRWKQPRRGYVPPSEFIPVAESNKLIVDIGEWVFRDVCRQNVAWQDAGMPPMNFSVNISPLQLKDSRLIQSVEDAITATGIDPTLIEIEITESGILENIEGITIVLERLRQHGISVSIDDFGTGYSSLTHLKQLPIDKLKIDRSFVTNVMIGNDDAKITSAIVSLGKKLGLEVIAEGVEEQAQLEFLRREGCDQAQGFYFAPPLPAADFFQSCVKAPEQRRVVNL